MTLSASAPPAAPERAMPGPSLPRPANAAEAGAAAPRGPEEEPSHERERDDVAGTITLGGVRVQFELDRELGEMIVQVVDPATGALIRQMPSEEAIQVAKVMGRLQGLFVQRTA